MAIIIEQIDNDFLTNYLTSSANFSSNENAVICDSDDNILYATEQFLANFSGRYSVGEKFIGYKVPLHLSVEEDPIYSKFSGVLLCVKYKFRALYNKTLMALENNLSIPSLDIELLKIKLGNLNYTTSDLNTLLINIISSNIVFSKSSTNKLKIFDNQDNLIYETLMDSDSRLLNHTNIREILSVTTGEYLGKVEEHSQLFKTEVSPREQ